jgi:geranylgeranyl diphosphate synthase type II
MATATLSKKKKTSNKPTPSFDLKKYIETNVKKVEKAMDRLLPTNKLRPGVIHDAMRHSIFAGGKRLRPILCLAAIEALGKKSDPYIDLATTLEMQHTFSLIHDDLPCIDNDDLRRGKPTCHKAFGEATAVLAGDNLIFTAMMIAAKAKPSARYTAADYCYELGDAMSGVIRGELADILAERTVVSPKELDFIHLNKTARLVEASVRLGGMAGNATPAELKNLTLFGRYLGLAFQVIDDILDVTATAEELGKTPGKDAAQGKATYPGVHGLEKSQREAARLTTKCLSYLKPFGKRGAALQAIADYLLKRKN